MPVPSPGFIAGPDVPPEEAALAKKKIQTWNRSRKLIFFSLGAKRIGDSLARFPKSMWRYTSDRKKWCIGQILWHLTDQEANLYIRLRRAAAEPGSIIAPYDQNKWNEKTLYLKGDFNDALNLLQILRKTNSNSSSRDCLRKFGKIKINIQNGECYPLSI